MERLSDTAIEIINDLHTERLEYTSEYIPLIDSANKLAEYEDLEEQGLILRLPCKVGDTVYRLGYKPCHNGETYPDSYDCCGCEDDCDIKRDIIPCFVRDLDWVLRNYKYLTSKNDYMFLTKEEAEAKLKELEGSEEE